MNRLALLVVAAAVLVWVGQWIAVRAGDTFEARALTPRLHARLVWWTAHRATVGASCVVVAVAGLAGGVIAG